MNFPELSLIGDGPPDPFHDLVGLVLADLVELAAHVAALVPESARIRAYPSAW
jgi:hypothetical protein